MSERKHSVFRPCIDLHGGVVKQIVGSSLSDDNPSTLKTNFVSTQSAADFALLYKTNDLRGGHVIKLGAGNDNAAREALAAWPGGLQVGGGITDTNALDWISNGAEKIIVTSYLFPGGKYDESRLESLSKLVSKERLVVDLSCRRRDNSWVVAMNKWRDFTDTDLNKATLDKMSNYCSEFLIHAADVEGLCQGIDEELVEKLGEWATIPVTYAGGAKSIFDLDLVDKLSKGNVDLTYGSSLDIFGGRQVKFDDLVRRSKRES